METVPPKTAIAETPHIGIEYISNAADTAIFAKAYSQGASMLQASSRTSYETAVLLVCKFMISHQKAELRAQALRIGR